MHVNNLGGARLPVATSAGSSTQTARTSFSTLVQGSTSLPASSPAAIPGSSVVATTIANNSSGVPGAGIGAPYQQAMPTGVALPGVPGRNGAIPVHTQAPTAPGGPTSPATAGTPGTEFNGELAATMQQQQMLALRKLLQMSLMSFMGSIFTMGQQRPQPELE